MNRRDLRHVPLLLALLGAAPVLAAGDAVKVSGVWARATPPVASVGAAYLVIDNPGGAADRLVGAATPAAETVEIHSSNMHDGMMRMRQLDALEVAPGGRVELAPGGNHLMLIGLQGPLTESQHFPLRLRFERAGEVEVTVEVRAMTAGAGHDHHHHH